jgi:hypothetical protein
VLAALAAFFLAASLVTETAFRGQVPLGRAFAVAGLAFLILAVLVPYRPPTPRRRDVSEPHFGKTRSGLHVHLHTLDHLPRGNAVARFNARVALIVTRAVGTMWCAYVFALFDILALPTAIRGGLYGIVQWVASFFLQLVLLSIIMVGQDVQARASDARAAKTFDDAEESKAALAVALDRLDDKTEGGIKAVLDAVNALAAQSAAEPAVHVQAGPALSDAQVKQLTTAVQASLLEQAKRNRGGPGYGQ